MHTLTLINDIFAPSTWHKFVTDDVLASLQQHYKSFPKTARLYCGQISKSHDVTPVTEKDITAIAEMEGEFFMVEYPADPVTLTYIAYAIIAVIAIVAITNRPKLPNSIASRNQQVGSANNALQGRTNQPRLNGRIPDIFGTVHSTPDLIAVPYSIFKNHFEFEYSYMCVGRGAYAISADTVRDGQTIVSKIEGETVEIFAPFNSPNDGSSPQLRIGTAIDRPVISTVRSKSVNGQTLRAPNESTTTKVYNNLVGFVYPNKIAAITGNPVTFLGDYVIGDHIIVTTSDVPVFFGYVDTGGTGSIGLGLRSMRLYADGTIQFASAPLAGQVGTYIQLVNALINNGGGDIDFSGKYIVTAIAGDTITLQTPGNSNENWTTLAADFAGGPTPYTNIFFADTSSVNINFSGTYDVIGVADKELTLQSPENQRENNSWVWMPGLSLNGGDDSYGSDGATVTIGTLGLEGTEWIGPFVLDVATMNQVISNYIAVNGMYKDNGAEQFATSVQIQLGVTLCNSAGVALASEQYFTVTVDGSASVQSTRAATLFANTGTVGIYMVRSRRLTPKDLSFSGQIVDEVKWRDVYASSPVGAIDFGNVTTVHAVTQATQSALAISERQLNMVATRKLPVYHGGTIFGPDLAATNSADDIISFICRDSKIGNRPDSEVDYAQIYTTIQAVKDYFGVDVAGEFCYTFDSDNISFEEMISTIANSVFCTANRRGRVIELNFEKETEDSALLFNHRNKIPKTEKRTSNFGRNGNYDGVTFEYVSPVDGAPVSFYIPADRSAVNPKPVGSVGIRSETHAHLHAYREWNRIRYQNRAVEFTATQEAELISTNSRILVSDNTRPDTQDGDILSQSGLVLELSQPVTLLPGIEYVIMLQMPTGFVEIIPITATSDPYRVILTTPPSDTLSVSSEMAVRTVYEIVKADDSEGKAFLLTEKTPQNNFVIDLVAVNYDARYYQNDLDFA